MSSGNYVFPYYLLYAASYITRTLQSKLSARANEERYVNYVAKYYENFNPFLNING